MPRRLLPPTVEGGQRFTLSKTQLDELEGVSTRVLSADQEVALQDTCLNFLIFSKFESQAELGSAATRVYDSLIDELHRVVAALADILGNAINQDVLDELDARLQSLTPKDHVANVLERYLNLQNMMSAVEMHVSRIGECESPRAGIYANLSSQLDGLIENLSDIASRQTPQHNEVHVELDERLHELEATVTVARVLQTSEDLQRLAVKCRAEHVSRFGGVGRPMKNEALRNFIWALADLFEAADGTAGVTFRPIDDSLQSPFLAWITGINSFLPSGYQASPTALPDLVREVCRARNKIKKH